MFSIRNKRRLAAAAAAVLAAPLLWFATAGTSQAAAAAPADDWLHVTGNQIVDEAGNPVWLTGTNWFGFNAGERVFHGLWSANLTEVTKSMADRGINLVRVPISTQLLLEWKAGQAAVPSGVNTYANPELTGKTTLQVFDAFLALCRQYGMKVLLDVHSAEADNSGHNHPVWWKGTITTENFYQAWEWVTARYKTDDTLVAMDLKNEPHGAQNESPRAKWDSSTDADNWKHVAQTAARRILAINPKVLVLVEGIQAYPRPGATWSSPNTNPDLTPNFYNTWWGGNLRGVAEHPIALGADQDQLVYSPHDYGPLVFDQPWFQKAFDKSSLTADVWTPNWLYVHDSGTAPLLIGEWGGRLGQDPRQDKWMTALRDLIVEKKLHQTFWVLNPNSGDTGGLLLDDWKTWDEQKYALLKPALWQYAGKFVSLDHQVPLGGAGSTTGMSLAARYGGGTEPTGSASPSPSTSTPPVPTGACTATYQQTSAWSGGFQGEVTIKNTGTAAARSWTATWTNPAGTSVASLWNGVLSTSGSAVTVRNAAHNGALAAGASTTFGFVGSGPAATPVITCSAA
ncbi:cellulase family glycosylhydrolase [Actinoplanes sp. NPDC049599]|uniref:cellulase family glycosylhydrolase n=1 Tax=Actinoplanes sp. NPDC049599 TaxID=3363903 RepID=UPI0037A06E56